MMKTLSFILPFFIYFSGNSQSFEMPLDSGQWRYSLLAYDDEAEQYNTFCFHYTAIGDTTISNKFYYTIANEYMGQTGFFREENKQVFYVPNPMFYEWNSNFEEFQVFDFNLNTGDSTTLYLFEEYAVQSERVEVAFTDSILDINGSFRKEIAINNVPASIACDLRWVEGIGESRYLPFYFWPNGMNCFTNNTQIQFDCLKINDQIISGSCDCQLTNIQEITEIESLEVFPNPANDRISIKSQHTNELSIEIFSSSGKKISFYKAPEEIDISSLPTGLYFLKFTLGDKNSLQKLIKQTP